VRIDKRIPVAAGLGGGSSDAATALQLANAALDTPRSPDELHRIAARLGADVPFFLRAGAQLATGDGTELAPIELPSDYWVVLVMPTDEPKKSTGAVYAAFDERGGAGGFEERADTLRVALVAARTPRDLARLPVNDLASSPLSRELLNAGAFQADVSGAGPTVYGLFESAADADSAAALLQRTGRTLVTRPARR
jgi:4-diphosphocytidyl-2-C-methyl-D-erythritol kinase